MTVVNKKTTLETHESAAVMIRCKQCGHEREITAIALANIIGWTTPILSVLPGFRCMQEDCGERDVEAELVTVTKH